MNGIRGNSNEVKYPVGCASRVKQPAFSGSGSMSEADLDDLYEPKPDKKVVRVVTVIAYMFSVSLGAIVLSLYYLFLWNPYKGIPTTASTAAFNSTNNSNFHSSEPVTEALIRQTPTVTPLLNSTAVLLSTVPVLIPLIGSIANGLKGNSNLVTPKVSRYKQKRSSDKVLNYEDKVKTSFSPFFLPEKSHLKTELLMNKDNIFLESSLLKSEYKRSGEQEIGKNKFVGDDRQGVKERLRTLGFENVRTESPYETHKVINQPFYLEDPFTTYAKAQRAKGLQNSIQGLRHHFFHAKESTKVKNPIIPSSSDVHSSSSNPSLRSSKYI